MYMVNATAQANDHDLYVKASGVGLYWEDRTGGKWIIGDDVGEGYRASASASARGRPARALT